MTAVVCNFQKKTIFQCYINSVERVNRYTTHGFGDFLRGCCALYQLCKDNNWDFMIDFSSHPLASILLCHVPARNLSIDQVPHIFDKLNLLRHIEKQETMEVNVFTNLNLNGVPSSECKQFLIQNCLTPQQEFAEFFEDKLAEMGLEKKHYQVLHIRAGDHSFQGMHANEKFLRVVQLASERLKQENKQIVIISDNAILREQISSEYQFIQAKGTCVHLGQAELNEEAVKNTMLEFYLMANAEKVSTLSVYRWTSGFARWVCEIYDTPFECINWHHKAEFYYGVGNRLMDCAVDVHRHLVRENKICVKRKENFNRLFGDVVPNREKQLKITFDDDVSILLPEQRMRGYEITQSDI